MLISSLELLQSPAPVAAPAVITLAAYRPSRAISTAAFPVLGGFFMNLLVTDVCLGEIKHSEGESPQGKGLPRVCPLQK